MISFDIYLEKSEKQNEYKLKFEELNKSKYEYSSRRLQAYTTDYDYDNEDILKNILNNLNINFEKMIYLNVNFEEKLKY